MGRIREKQRWKCRECSEVTLEHELLTAPNPFCDPDELTGCPKCKQCIDGFDLLCDEIGCNSTAGCGWPTGNNADEWGGYRNTCFKHMKAHNAQGNLPASTGADKETKHDD